MPKYKTLSIGIDQSYKRTGISISADGEIKKITSINLEYYKTNTEKRNAIRNKLTTIIPMLQVQASKVVCCIERIRLQSDGFLNIDYIKSIGALNAVIVDTCCKYGVQVFSIDTRCWKAQVVGTSKPKSNNLGIDPKKLPTIEWVCAQGFTKSILVSATKQQKKGVFTINNVRYKWNDDAADSAAISLFPFKGKSKNMQLEH